MEFDIDRKAAIYYGRMLSLVDYLHGCPGERETEDFDRKVGCPQIASFMGELKNDALGERMMLMQKNVGNTVPGIGINTVLGADEWDLDVVIKTYNLHTERMLAADRLRLKYESEYLASGMEKPLYAMCNELGTGMWRLRNWMYFEDIMPNDLVITMRSWDGKSIEKLGRMWAKLKEKHERKGYNKKPQ